MENMEIPNYYKMAGYIPRTAVVRTQQLTTGKKIHAMRILFLMQRILRDEWDQFIYTSFDKNNGHEYYRKHTRSLIEKLYIQMKNSYSSLGFGDTFKLCDDIATIYADEIDNICKQCRNKIFSIMFNHMPYEYIEAMSYIIGSYNMAYTMYNFLNDNNIIFKNYMNTLIDIENIIKEYIDAMKIPLWKDCTAIIKQSYYYPLMVAISKITKKLPEEF